jgi:hypothetical protein
VTELTQNAQALVNAKSLRDPHTDVSTDAALIASENVTCITSSATPAVFSSYLAPIIIGPTQSSTVVALPSLATILLLLSPSEVLEIICTSGVISVSVTSFSVTDILIIASLAVIVSNPVVVYPTTVYDNPEKLSFIFSLNSTSMASILPLALSS